MEVFACGADNALWHIWQSLTGGEWSSWASLGGKITSVPAVGNNDHGDLAVFARGADGALWRVRETATDGSWSGWVSLGGIITSDPKAVISKPDGRLEVFARGADTNLWHIWQTSAGGGWSSWASLTGVPSNQLTITSDPIVALNQDGRLEVFALDMHGALCHIWETAADGIWSYWTSLAGTLTSDPTVVIDQKGQLHAFARWGETVAVAHLARLSRWTVVELDLAGRGNHVGSYRAHRSGRAAASVRAWADDALWFLLLSSGHVLGRCLRMTSFLE